MGSQRLTKEWIEQFPMELGFRVVIPVGDDLDFDAVVRRIQRAGFAAQVSRNQWGTATVEVVEAETRSAKAMASISRFRDRFRSRAAAA